MSLAVATSSASESPLSIDPLGGNKFIIAEGRLDESKILVTSQGGQRYHYPTINTQGLITWLVVSDSQSHNARTIKTTVTSSKTQVASDSVVFRYVNEPLLDRWIQPLARITGDLLLWEESGEPERIDISKRIANEVNSLPISVKNLLFIDLLLSKLYWESNQAKEVLSYTDSHTQCYEINHKDTVAGCENILLLRIKALQQRGQFLKSGALIEKLRQKLISMSSHPSDAVLEELFVLDIDESHSQLHAAVSSGNHKKISQLLEHVTKRMASEEYEKLSDIRNKASVTFQFGSMLARSGRFVESLPYLENASKLYQEIGDKTTLPFVYSLLFSVNTVVGKHKDAFNSITSALQLSESTDDYNYHFLLLNQARALANLGRYEQSTAGLKVATSYFTENEDGYLKALGFRARAIVERELGNLKTARSFHKQALDEFKGPGGKLDPKRHYAYMVSLAEQLETEVLIDNSILSEGIFEELSLMYIRLVEMSDVPESMPRKRSLLALAGYALSANRLEEFHEYTTKLSVLLAATSSDTYLREKASLIKLNLIEALQKNEADNVKQHLDDLVNIVQKSRSLLGIESLHRGFARVVKSYTDPIVEALAQELLNKKNRESGQQLIFLLQQRQGVSTTLSHRKARTDLRNTGQQTESKLDDYEASLLSAKSESEQLKLRANIDHLTIGEELKQPLNDTATKFDIASLDTIQSNLDSGQLILNSFETHQSKYLLLIRQNDLQIKRIDTTEELKNSIESLSKKIRRPGEKINGELENISKLLEIKSVIRPDQDKRIFLLNTGLLSQIPFAALKIDIAYLAESIQINNIYSLSVFSNKEKNATHVEHTHDLAMVADPIFDKDYLIASSRGTGNKEYVNWLESLSRLPWTAKEAQYIEELFTDKKLSINLRENATVDLLQETSFRNSKVMHLASHGYYSPATPDLAGLAMTKSAKNRSGFLSLSGLSRLNFPSQLVVLSGCETLLGTDNYGEGNYGLAQAFIRNGAKSVIGTSWSIPDRQTAIFMRNFYKALKSRDGDIAAALHEGQLSLIKSDKYSHPFYWASFELYSIIDSPQVSW